jgi:hypothetical protein
MTPIRKLLLVTVGVLAFHGVQACASETELNPQPLPPTTGEPARSPNSDEKAGDSNDPTGAAGSSGGSGSPTPPPQDADGGTDASDAADGGHE